MTRRERLERKLEKRGEWAEARDRDATSNYNRARSYTDGIPFGQPILVGHHSEKRHRRALEKSDNAMRRASESSDMAAHHRSKAGGLADQLENSIFSDDPDAIEQLEARVAEIEAECDRRTAVNKAIKKGKGLPGWDASLSPPLSDEERQELATQQRLWGHGSDVQLGFPSYANNNARNNARRLRERIKTIQHRQKRAAEAEAGGCIVARSGTYGNITFPEKPPREILEALKAAGWGWMGGSWGGYLDKLTNTVTDYCVGLIFEARGGDPNAIYAEHFGPPGLAAVVEASESLE
jgi:hypothetical protein